MQTVHEPRSRIRQNSGLEDGPKSGDFGDEGGCATRPRYTVRAALRDVLVVVAAILTLPLWLVAQAEALLTGGEACFAFGAELLSLVPGKPGIFLRRGFYWMTLECFATDCCLGFLTTVSHRQVRVGQRVYVGNRCTLGMAVIEDDVAIGSNVDILSGRRQHGTGDLNAPIQAQERTFTRVWIGRNSWIGNSAVVMADVGADCVIGAGSVVVKPIPAHSVAAGNPATVKKRREE